MHFEENHIYHIFNQGNNKQKIFYSDSNYLFFLKKVKIHICPFAEILAWCLMPNHFHLMIYVKNKCLAEASPYQKNHAQHNLQNSLGTMLSSYVRAINIEQCRTGSLFRKQTKSVCLTESLYIAKAWFLTNGISEINILTQEKMYPNICFNYIMMNPVNAGLVKKPEEWIYSSYLDFIDKREGSLISRNRIIECGLCVNRGEEIESGHDAEQGVC